MYQFPEDLTAENNGRESLRSINRLITTWSLYEANILENDA